MSDIGQVGSQKDHPEHPVENTRRVKRGRPKKSQEELLKEQEQEKCIREEKIQELLDQAVTLFEIPFDDRVERHPDAPTLSSVAAEMETSRMRVRKLLITAGFYSTVESRLIGKLYNAGKTVSEISEITGLGRSAVHSYLPFNRVVYKMEEPSLNAKQCKLFQTRKKTCKLLEEHMDDDQCLEYLWEAIRAFSRYNFRTENGRKFKYTVDSRDSTDCKEGEIIRFGYLTLCREEIEKAFLTARQIQKKYGCVCDEDDLSCKGAEELYAIFLRIGACCKSIQKF